MATAANTCSFRCAFTKSFRLGAPRCLQISGLTAKDFRSFLSGLPAGNASLAVKGSPLRRRHGGEVAPGLSGGAAGAPLHAAGGRLPVPGGGRRQPVGDPQGALHRDRLAGVHAGGGGLRQRHPRLRAAAGRHRAAGLPRRLCVPLPGAVLRHGPRGRHPPGAAHLRRALPAQPAARLPHLLPHLQGPPVRLLLHVLRLLPHPLHLRLAALQRPRGHGHPLPRYQLLPGGPLVLGLPAVQPGRVSEDERPPLCTRAALSPPAALRPLGLHPQALHLCRAPGGLRAALPAGESCGVPDTLLRPGPSVPVQVDSELALPPRGGVPAPGFPCRVALGTPVWLGALCAAPMAQVQRKHPISAEGSSREEAPISPLECQQDCLHPLLLQLPGHLLQPFPALPVLRLVLPHTALPAVVHPNLQARSHAQGAVAGRDRALLEHLPLHCLQLPLPAHLSRTGPTPAVVWHSPATSPTATPAQQEVRSPLQEGTVRALAGQWEGTPGRLLCLLFCLPCFQVAPGHLRRAVSPGTTKGAMWKPVLGRTSPIKGLWGPFPGRGVLVL